MLCSPVQAFSHGELLGFLVRQFPCRWNARPFEGHLHLCPRHPESRQPPRPTVISKTPPVFPDGPEEVVSSQARTWLECSHRKFHFLFGLVAVFWGLCVVGVAVWCAHLWLPVCVAVPVWPCSWSLGHCLYLSICVPGGLFLALNVH